MRIRDEHTWARARGELEARFAQRKRYDWPEIRTWTIDDDEVREIEFLAGHWLKPTDRAPREKPWLISGVLRRSKQRSWIVSELSIEPGKDNGGEVTGTLLRGINVANIREQVLGKLPAIALAREVMPEFSEEAAARVRSAADEAGRQSLNRGRGGYPLDHYRRIAFRYLELLGAGHRKVLVELAAEESERLGRQVPRETIRDWVRKATRLGFLAPGKPGRAEPRPGRNLYRKEEDHG